MAAKFCNLYQTEIFENKTKYSESPLFVAVLDFLCQPFHVKTFARRVTLHERKFRLHFVFDLLQLSAKIHNLKNCTHVNRMCLH